MQRCWDALAKHIVLHADTNEQCKACHVYTSELLGLDDGVLSGSTAQLVVEFHMHFAAAFVLFQQAKLSHVVITAVGSMLMYESPRWTATCTPGLRHAPRKTCRADGSLTVNHTSAHCHALVEQAVREHSRAETVPEPCQPRHSRPRVAAGKQSWQEFAAQLASSVQLAQRLPCQYACISSANAQQPAPC